MVTKKRATKQELLNKLVNKKQKLNISWIDEEPYRAVLRIHSGKGKHEDIYIICFRLYVGIEFCKLFNEGRIYEREITEALLHMENVMSFNKKHDKVLFGDNQAKLVTYSLNYITEMQKMVMYEELINVYKTVEKRLQTKKGEVQNG